MKILIIDDSMIMRNIVKNVLREHKYSDDLFAEAGDGETALAIAVKEDVCLFLVDWNMPKLDGLGFIKKIRAIPKYAKTPILMITSEAAKYNVMEAIEAGTTAYIIKPLKADILWPKLEKYMPKVET